MSGTPHRLSAVVITRDEEVNLPGLLSNLKGWIDEVIIVDDRSSDSTEKIATEAGAWVRFLRHPMTKEGGFAGQRNVGIAAATGDWLVHMDCDERFSAALADELKHVLRTSELNAYRYRRLNYFLNRPMRHGGWNTWNRAQIARRGAHHFEGRLHETCRISGGNSLVGQLESVMHHLNDIDFAYRLRKSAKYVEMEADRIAAEGMPVRIRELIFCPAMEFVKKYLVKRGFLDRAPGLIAAIHAATAVFRAHALVWDRQQAIDRRALESELLLRFEADGPVVIAKRDHGHPT